MKCRRQQQLWTTSVKLEQYKDQTGNLEIKDGPPVIVGKKMKRGNVSAYRRNIQARSCEHCCRGKAISTAYSECVFVVLVIHNVYNIRYTDICGLSGSTIFLPFSLTYLLTPWCRVLLEKLTGLQLVKKFPAFYGILRFITAFSSAHHLSLSRVSSIQSTPPHPTS